MIKKLGKNIFTSNFYKNILKIKIKHLILILDFLNIKAIMYIKWKNLNYLKMTSKELLISILIKLRNLLHTYK